MSNLKIGFVGLGRMGLPMAGRLLDADFDVTVFDVDSAAVDRLVAKGATSAGSPRAVADDVDVVVTSLPKPPIVRAVGLDDDGIVNGTRAKIMLDVSTTGPSTAREVAQGLAEMGKQWVDCPVSGGIAGAEKGTLALMVSCPTETYQTVLPILEVFGNRSMWAKKPGWARWSSWPTTCWRPRPFS